jgi:pimeloyl-ACP methyl ester carboxylesterase
MKKNFLFLLSIVFAFSFLAQASMNISTEPQVASKDIKDLFLSEEGFKKYIIKTSDNYFLEAVFLERPHAKGTLLICSGLNCPKDPMYSFYPILPKDYNVLLFDARGHGNSSGSLLYKPWQYGLHEYNDIIALLDFIINTTTSPIIIYGTCAGGFNAIHALLFLQKNKQLEKYPIKGLIFDSGWASRIQAVQTVAPARLNRFFKIIALYLMGTKLVQKMSNWRSVAFLNYLVNVIPLSLLHIGVIKPLLLPAEKESNLYDKIRNVTIPIFFIHSIDDSWVAFDHMRTLSSKAHNPLCWWITTPSKHSSHYLIYPDLYREKIAQFCNNFCNN